MTRWALLWAGPMDGERVFLGDGDAPARLGMHRTADGALVCIRTRAVLEGRHGDHVQVYERATVDVLRAIAAWRGHLDAHTPLVSDPDAALYVHREVVTRWLAQT